MFGTAELYCEWRKSMTFSVVIAVYNVEQYLEECLESILTQTYKDYEVILVDDGSKDKSPEICDRYAEQYPQISVIHKKNGGASSARNEGLRHASGAYVLFLDSDDYIKSNDFFERLAEKKATQPDVILYKFEKYYESTKMFEECSFHFPKGVEGAQTSEIIEQLVRLDALYCAGWTKSIKRKLLLENDIMFKEGIIGEDQDWYFQVLLKVKKIEMIDDSFIVYRQRDNSVTSSWKMKNLTDCIYIIEKWNDNIRNAQMDAKMQTALLGVLAKLYCNMLIAYSRFKDSKKKQYEVNIKQLAELLKYTQNSRVRMIAKVYKMIGFKGTIFSLQIIDGVNKLRRR